METIGGQAVLSGVMMRTRERWVVAVRLPEGEIARHAGTTPAWARRVDRLPLIRGVVALGETLVLGSRALSWSAAHTGAETTTTTTHGDAAWKRRLAGVVAVALAVALFAVVPALAARAASPVIGDGIGPGIGEGLLRLLLFVAYVAAIRLSPGVREAYGYHGAEHMAIAAYEAGDGLDPAAMRRRSRLHARCGTDFLLLIVALSAVLFAVVPADSAATLAATRVLLLPVVAGLTYELLRLARRFPRHPLVRVMVAPGMALQRITTREPSDAQLEVAAAALQLVLEPSATRPAS